MRRLAAGVVAVALVVSVGCGGDDDGETGSATSSSATATSASTPTSSTASNPPSSSPGTEREPLEGFGEVAFRILQAGEAVGEWCALLADDQASRSRGLMEQRDLRGYDGMLFAFEAPSTGSFYMRNTPLPLSIAFFDDDGALVSATDMDPCEDREGCPLYDADGPYVHALEVEQGDLPSLGVEGGAVLEVGGACPP